MTNSNEQPFNDLGIWHDAEERAAWLLRNAVTGGIVIGNNNITSIEELTKIIYNREVERLKADEKSLFERENIIPTKEIPVDEEEISTD